MVMITIEQNKIKTRSETCEVSEQKKKKVLNLKLILQGRPQIRKIYKTRKKSFTEHQLCTKISVGIVKNLNLNQTGFIPLRILTVSKQRRCRQKIQGQRQEVLIDLQSLIRLQAARRASRS